MKLLYELHNKDLKALELANDEVIKYCVPYDLPYDANKRIIGDMYIKGKNYIVVTNERFIIFNQDGGHNSYCIHKQYKLSECEEIKCESQVNNGIIVITRNGAKECAVRFSMRHIVRISYVAQGANLLAKGDTTPIESHEYEKYCEKCGRAMPGTSKCPRCDGKAVVLKKFLDLCGGYHIKLLLISAFMILASAIAILVPKIQADFIDNSLKDKTGTLKDVGVFVISIMVLNALLICINIAKNWWCRVLGTSISLDLRKKVYNKIQILSLSFINKRKPGELMNRVSGDTNRIRRFMEDVFGGMLSALFTMVASFIMMLVIDVKMTLYSTMLIVVVIVVTRLFWGYIHRIFHRQWIKEDKMRSGLQDVISGMRVVKAFGKEEDESRKFAGYTEEFAKISKNNETFFAIFYPVLTFIMGMGSYVAVYLGGANILNGRMEIGELIQFMAYSGYLFGPLGWMTNLPRSILDMLTSLNRIYDVLDENPAITDKEDSIELDIKGEVEINHISFGYNSYEPVLEDINFSVKKGEMIGIVGASGTGKSTLINLIMRLYDVDRGSIKIDGVDIRNIKKECLHSQLGVVLQETFLFSGTILNNLKFAKPDATYEEIIRATKAANAHDFICKMPDGYNTYVGEHGYNLSGGERQRVAIARAILNNPKLLILDEATSALDTESEFLIQQAFDRLTEGRTTFAIAHRLSTLRNADRLIVIDGHELAEIGTHNELLEKKGLYYGLVNAQLEMSKVNG